MAVDRRILYDDLRQLFFDAFTAVGVPENVARTEAEIGAEVDLCGVHSHGVRLLTMMVENIQQGQTNPDPQVTVISEHQASALAQTENGLGRYVSAVSMDMAIQRAETFGIGAVALKGAAHWGRAYSYALRAARKGMLGIACTNAISNFPAWGTSAPSLANNPMAIGVPAGEGGEPVVMDISMTPVAIGKIRDAADEGHRVPLGWGLDRDGKPTDDPTEIMESRRFLPMGDHKGSALAFAIELLTAGLAGGFLCFELGHEGRPSDVAGGSSKLFIAIKPFGEWLPERVSSLKEHLKAAPKAPEQGEAMWPGEGSFRRREAYLKEGIPITPKLAEDLEELADELGVTIGWMG
jgi:LDH2 family malate/lactate/ureidoglycolate dehydrogenase